MAIVYELWVETGESTEARLKIQNYFESVQIIETKMGKYPIWVHQCGYKGTMITVDDISTTGPNSIEEEKEMSLIGYEFYKHLLNAPDFRYALTGFDIDGCFEMEELEEDPSNLLIKTGVVIQKELYKKVGSPGAFVEFREGYVWSPYNGEV